MDNVDYKLSFWLNIYYLPDAHNRENPNYVDCEWHKCPAPGLSWQLK